MCAILQKLGFLFDGQEGSHQQWRAADGRKVTVDQKYQQCDVSLIKIMVKQAKVSREVFYRATKTTARKIQ